VIEALMFWNEPNNLSHWDFELDREWADFSHMTIAASERVRAMQPALPLVLGGISPIDPAFIRRMDAQGVLAAVDIVGVHGFPLDWNHWPIGAWPQKLAEIRAVTSLPIWVTEVGVSSFGADEVQVFGVTRTAELLRGRAERIFWYSLFDLPAGWEATTRHREAEGSAYYRHFYMGLIREDGSPKPAIEAFDPALGICQWFHFEDHRLDSAVSWLRRLGVRKLRTGLSWADWYRPGAQDWFDRQMEALDEFDTTVTLCFTPPSLGKRPHHTSPPKDLTAFADFAEAMVDRYVRQPIAVSRQP